MARLGDYRADAPYTQFAAITKHDTNNIQLASVDTPCDAIYVGGAGDIAVVDQHGTAFTFSAVPAGTVLKVAAKRVNSTNTTATLLTALFF